MRTRRHDDEGRLVEQWNDETREHTVWDVQTGEVLEVVVLPEGTEPLFIAEPKAEAENERFLRLEAAGMISTLQGSVEALRVISDKANADITARDTKDVAREARRLARQMIVLTRLVARELDSTT